MTRFPPPPLRPRRRGHWALWTRGRESEKRRRRKRERRRGLRLACVGWGDGIEEKRREEN